jgi:hypothetical protein
MNSVLQAGQIYTFYGMVEAVTVIAETNIALTGLQDLDGATGVDGDRVACVGQTTSTEDGIYVMRSGAWERAFDASADDPAFDLGKMEFVITKGNKAGEKWRFTNLRGAGVVGVDDLAAAKVLDAGGTNEVCNEIMTPTGDFTATSANAPIVGTQKVYRNGQRLNPGAGNDYTFTGSTFTFARKLTPNTVLLIDYKYA